MTQHPKPDKSSEKDSSSTSSGIIWGTHHYEVTSLPICNTRTGGCSSRSVYEMMTSRRSFVTPSSGTESVTDGSTTKIDYLGSVKHKRDDEHLTVTNTTQADHWLYPGTVKREVQELSNGDIVVKTTGDGEGLAPGLNNYLAPRVWGGPDSALGQAMREKLSGKKEKD